MAGVISQAYDDVIMTQTKEADVNEFSMKKIDTKKSREDEFEMNVLEMSTTVHVDIVK